MSPLTLAFLLLLSLAMLEGSVGNQQNATTPDKDVRYTLQVVGPEPLPYQAVRLRLVAQNQSTKGHGPIKDLFGVNTHFRNGNKPDRLLGELQIWWSFSTAFHYRFPRTGTPPWLAYTRDWQVFLQPEERISVSWVLCGDFLVPGTRFPESPQFVQVKPLLSESGTYQFACPIAADRLFHLDKAPEFVTPTLKINVRVPQGQDKDFCELLQKDAKLTSVLLWPVNVPTEEQLPKLRQVILQYPKSSYTPYAKFALARYYYARKASKAERETGIQILRDLLEPLRPDFPFEPYAIAALLELDPTSHAKWVPVMDREYPDAVEWLDEYRFGGDKARVKPNASLWDLLTPEERAKYTITWAEYRKRVPVDRWAKPVEKK